MAITNFGTLKTEVATWLNRTDLSGSTLATFVQLAESDIRNDVRIRSTVTILGGVVSVLNFTLPSDLLEIRSFIVDDHQYKYVPPEEFAQLVTNQIDGRYTILGTQIYLTSGLGGSFEMVYWPTVVALSADSDTTDLLTQAPQVYLWAACKHGCVFLRDDDGAARFDSMYRQAVATLNAVEKRGELGNSLSVTAL